MTASTKASKTETKPKTLAKPKAKAGLSDYNKFVRDFSKSYKGTQIITAAAKAWRSAKKA
jgi:hypothetical protein